MFFSDLVKKIKLPIEIDFVNVKSYDGQNRKEIKFTKDLEVDIKGKTCVSCR
jgi:hypoxanthine-guanine phosphoribosyltransferase